jgi:hypothetical protein
MRQIPFLWEASQVSLLLQGEIRYWAGLQISEIRGVFVILPIPSAPH